MRVPTGTSKFISRTVGSAAVGIGSVLWARGTISVVGAIAILVSIHFLALIAEELESDGDTA